MCARKDGQAGPAGTQPYYETSNDEPEAKGAAGVLISPTVIKILVSVYLLWIEKEVTTGILSGKIQASSVIYLSIACVVLFGGILWLLIPLVKRFCKKSHVQGR